MTPENPDEPDNAKPPEMSDEHPISLLLFAPLRGENGRTTILWGLAGICIGLAIMGFFVEPGHHFPLESVPLFYAAFGFAAFGAAVLSGWPLGKWLRRPEDFYTRKSSRSETGDNDTGEAAPDA